MKILVACNGSQRALRAVKYASGLARLRRSPDHITLVNVHDNAGRHDEGAVNASASVGLMKLSDKELTAARDLLEATGVDFDVEIRTGHVAQEISRCADEGAFDVVVLGPQRHGAVADRSTGSVEQTMLVISSQPVVVVR